MLSILLQVAVGLLLYLALGEAGVAPEVRMASAFAPLLLYPLAFLWKMFSVPAAMHEDQRKEANQERIAQVFYLGQLYIKEVAPENAQLINYSLAMPPEEWLNWKLEELDYRWRVRIIHGTQYVTEDVA